MTHVPTSPQWDDLSLKKIEIEFGVDPQIGLSQSIAAERLETVGTNTIPRPRMPGVVAVWLRQFKSPLIGILLLAAAALFLIEHITDACVILFVLMINSCIGTFHEYRASKTVEALRKLTPRTAVVRRENTTQTISADHVVPGDILLLSEGDHVVADARLVESNFLRVDESMLTGESVPVMKDVATHTKHAADPLAHPQLLFAGSAITHGNGVAIVVATGASTRLGELSGKLQPTRAPIPLENDIRAFSRIAIVIIVVLTVCIYLVGIKTGVAPVEMAFVAVALAASAIPEGLPAVLTIVLASGMRRLAKRQVLVKKLFAVEALGQTRILALDKTGTITFNRLLVAEVCTARGAVHEKNIGPLMLEHELSFVARLPAHAHVRATTHGDPTEAALLAFAQKLNVAELHTPERSIPFDYNSKLSHAFFKESKLLGPTYSIVGAPETVLAACSEVQYAPDDLRSLDEHERDALAAQIQQMAERGLRVIAVARKPQAHEDETAAPHNFIFEGLLGLADAIRPEVPETIARVKGAGLKVIMVTGDLPATARAVARTVGIFEPGDHVLTGTELQTLSESELRALLPRASVFARVSPEDKLRIIEAYEKNGYTIAMTGDGVNDAPSLVASHIGIAMAESGTDVARQAADILLLNDNVESLVAAIDEGRTMYQRLRTVLMYLATTNFGEICMIATAIFFRLPVPLTAVQIIWLNLVTDGFLDVSLALEPKDEKSVAPKLSRGAFLLRGTDVWGIVGGGIIMTAGTLFLFLQHTELSLAEKRSAALLLMALFQWMHAWALRTERRSMFSVPITRNPYLIGATLIVLALQLAALYIPFMNTILETAPLPTRIWGEALLIACSLVLFEEIRKFLRRAKHPSTSYGTH